MDGRDGPAERFEAQRDRLRAVAYRMLGSLSEADDAVQEAWLRLGRVDAGQVDNLAGWLRTVVTRICLDMLRSRRSRREDLTGQQVLDQVCDPAQGSHRCVAGRLGEPSATKKLASRARHKVQGNPVVPAAELARHRRVVSAFLAAARAGDLTAILAVLAPDVVRHADPVAVPPGGVVEQRGARAVAEETVVLAGRSQFAELALVNGTVGLVVAPRGRLLLALTFTIENDKIAGYDVIADPARLQQLDLAVLN